MAAKSLGWYISFFLPTEIRLVSKQLLLNDKSKLFQLYYDKNKLFLVRWWWCLFCTRPNGWVQFFSERKVHSLKYCSTQRHYPNSEGNQSLLLFFIAACLAEKQQIPILYSGLTRTHNLPQVQHTNNYLTEEVKFRLRIIINTVTGCNGKIMFVMFSNYFIIFLILNYLFIFLLGQKKNPDKFEMSSPIYM
jgi:hypothetical protein